MEIKGIKYISPTFDSSGYGQASRGYILALHKKGIPITLEPVSFEGWTPNLGKQGEILEGLIDNRIDYNIVIVHLTPEFWESKVELDKVNLGYTVWETDKLHPKWPKYINDSVQAVMVGCDWNIEVFKNSGVEVPVHVVPHGIDFDEFKNIEPYTLAGVNENAFKFYDVFQFTERKHPVALIKSYWHAFQKGENVALILKTYKNDFTDGEKDKVKEIVKKLKNVTPMENYPPVYLILDQLSREEVLGVHKTGDCFVSLDRGEGFGLGGFEAGACGNPIIVTGIGGALEYAKPEHSYLVDYSLTPVSGMPWCISLNSLVKTDNGYCMAGDLEKGDKVENKNLHFKSINKIEFRSLFDDEDVYSLKYFSMPDPVVVTSEHKLYVINEENKPVRKKVSDINVGDYLYVPKHGKVEEFKFCHEYYNFYEENKKANKLFYLFGLYLAEGYIDKIKKTISFSFNINEKHTLGFKCKKYMKELFNIKENNIYERDLEDRHGYELTFYTDHEAKDLINEFENCFGSGSHYKFIVDKVKYNYYNKELLKGYWDGDGHIRKEGYKNKKTGKKRISPECVAETASFDLVMDLRDVLLSLDIVPSIYNDKREDGRLCYVISVSHKLFDRVFNIEANRINSKFKKVISNGFGVLVTKKELLENYDDLICSISVELDEDENKKDGGSYILNGIASSNSPWYLGDQMWAEPDCGHAVSLLRHVYENQDESKEKGKLLRKYIKDNFSWDKVADKMIEVIHKM